MATLRSLITRVVAPRVSGWPSTRAVVMGTRSFSSAVPEERVATLNDLQLPPNSRHKVCFAWGFVLLSFLLLICFAMFYFAPILCSFLRLAVSIAILICVVTIVVVTLHILSDGMLTCQPCFFQ